MQRGAFITGTNTDVGKTWVGLKLAQHLMDAGVTVEAKKPIESGCEVINNTPHPKDALAYQAITQQPLDDICAYPLKAALSPQHAMQLEHQHITTEHIFHACQSASNSAFRLVEGAGGFMSPLSANGLNQDLATALNLPIIVVTNNILGCINHTLLTLQAIEHSGQRTACVVVNPIQHSTDFTHGLNEFCPYPILNTRTEHWLNELTALI